MYKLCVNVRYFIICWCVASYFVVKNEVCQTSTNDKHMKFCGDDVVVFPVDSRIEKLEKTKHAK